MKTLVAYLAFACALACLGELSLYLVRLFIFASQQGVASPMELIRTTDGFVWLNIIGRVSAVIILLGVGLRLVSSDHRNESERLPSLPISSDIAAAKYPRLIPADARPSTRLRFSLKVVVIATGVIACLLGGCVWIWERTGDFNRAAFVITLGPSMIFTVAYAGFIAALAIREQERRRRRETSSIAAEQRRSD